MNDYMTQELGYRFTPGILCHFVRRTQADKRHLFRASLVHYSDI